jgi:hypothetical protein
MGTRFHTQVIHYLGTPYSHPDPAVQMFRYRAVTLLAHQFFTQGKLAYSPITHNISLDHLGIHGCWQVWREFDECMLARCGKLIVFQLPGWKESRGLQNEIEFAQTHGLPTEYIEPERALLERAAQRLALESVVIGW